MPPPTTKPLLRAICLVFGSAVISTMNGVLPLRVRIFTTPFDRSPYSTDGMPVTTSTDSMFETPRLRRSAPLVSESVALFASRMPSTSTAVPNEALPSSLPLPACRAMRELPEARFWSPTVLPPGSSVAMWLMLSIWACSIVRRSMTYDEPDSSLRRCAVTTTSPIERFDSRSATSTVACPSPRRTCRVCER